jgi:hydroxyethylthiazole kinase-like uncharacterized protein yjeF
MCANQIDDSHPILSRADAKAWEAGLLKDEAAEWAAMQRAGSAIARAIEEDFEEIGGLLDHARILVLLGKGHNGGDAAIAATTLLKARPQATVEILRAFQGSPSPLAKRALDELTKAVGEQEKPFDWKRAEASSYDLCLDGIFGLQFRLPLDEATTKTLAWVNAHPRIRLRAAVDLPSGVGEQNADAVFRADFTYAAGIVKSPVVAEANAPFVGRLRYLDLGFFRVGRVVPAALDRVLLPSILAPMAWLRPAQTDKRTYGHLFVVGGSRNYPGSVLMTVQAALRSGVGLLTAFVPASLVPEYAAKFPEAMWVGWPETTAGGLAASGVKLLRDKLPRATALAIGPGLGAEAETLAAVQDIVHNMDIPFLLDADALRPEIVAAAAGKRLIVTPHAGELKRLGGRAGLQPSPGLRLTDRPANGGECVLVLKGPITRIAAEGGRLETGPTYHSFFGGPVLARGGSGDLLAGLIGGLLAQGPGDLLLAACRGVVWHGLAADLLARDKGQVAVQTTQLLDYLQPALHAAL